MPWGVSGRLWKRNHNLGPGLNGCRMALDAARVGPLGFPTMPLPTISGVLCVRDRIACLFLRKSPNTILRRVQICPESQFFAGSSGNDRGKGPKMSHRDHMKRLLPTLLYLKSMGMSHNNSTKKMPNEYRRVCYADINEVWLTKSASERRGSHFSHPNVILRTLCCFCCSCSCSRCTTASAIDASHGSTVTSLGPSPCDFKSDAHALRGANGVRELHKLRSFGRWGSISEC